MFRKRETTVQAKTGQSAAPPSPIGQPGYERPQVIRIGSVYELTRGSSSSGNSDANSQYYW